MTWRSAPHPTDLSLSRSVLHHSGSQGYASSRDGDGDGDGDGESEGEGVSEGVSDSVS